MEAGGSWQLGGTSRTVGELPRELPFKTEHDDEPGWWLSPTPRKNMKVNWDDDIPNIWKNKKMVQTSNQMMINSRRVASKLSDNPRSVETSPPNGVWPTSCHGGKQLMGK